jgi:hypothetical protein
MKYFITFGNNEFKNQTLRLKHQAEATKWFDKIIIENENSIVDFYHTHQSFIDNNSRGFGYWIWKPYIINRLLNNMSYNDYLFYTDAGASIIPHKYNELLKYISILDSSNKPILTFSAEYTEKKFQKRIVLEYFDSLGYNLSYDESFLNSSQIESGIFICKKTSFVTDFVQQWLNLCLLDNYKLVIDSKEKENEYFIEHRHDQSILSILCKINNTNIICCHEAYGLGPFFSSRLTDDLPRRFAPDLFRTDIRYNPNIHFTWKEWLMDYPNSRYNYEILLKNIDKIA